MDYITADAAAEKWGVSPRQVQRLLAAGRIPGAIKFGRAWMIPAETAKPGDPRFAKKASENSLAAAFSSLIEATIVPWPASDPDAILNSVREPRLRLQFEGELAYLRGDYQHVVDCFRMLGNDEAAKLRACSLTIAAAVSMGNYPLYLEIESHLKSVMQKHSENKQLCAFAELCLATASTGAIAPDMAPIWLKSGDFSALPPKTRPDAAHKRAKYFQCIGKFESMLSVAETARSLCAPDDGLSFHSVYFLVDCAIACALLGRDAEATRWLSDALKLGLPHGFTAPFAESITAFRGLLEPLLARNYPEYREAIQRQWQSVFANWIAFHNQFTRDNITSMLSLREYEMASMVARHVPRAQIAERFHISTGRLNNIMKEIYGKLFVSGREELSQYIL